MPRIVSFLPAATEITYALGAGADLVGRSHECDYPPEVRSLPVVSKPTLPLEGLSQSEIDHAVATKLATGESLYQVDEKLLDELHPDLVFTQDLCQVCAPSGNELSRALLEMSQPPQVLSLTPRNFAEIEENILAIGDATGRREAAELLVDKNRERLRRVLAAVGAATPRRVTFLEWTEPLFCGGHWVPEMVATACGYGLKEAIAVAKRLPRTTDAEVYAVDANAYFARPGPRVAEGVELLAQLFHPDKFEWPHEHRPW